jgi:hypothetical protein
MTKPPADATLPLRTPGVAEFIGYFEAMIRTGSADAEPHQNADLDDS